MSEDTPSVPPAEDPTGAPPTEAPAEPTEAPAEEKPESE